MNEASKWSMSVSSGSSTSAIVFPSLYSARISFNLLFAGEYGANVKPNMQPSAKAFTMRMRVSILTECFE